jgi:3-oxoacyl-[acyl-carrier-protein] synthase-3
VSGDETAVDLGVKAALQALEKAKINPEELDLIISATSIPTNLYPSTSCEIQAAINAKNAAAFDITAACTGFIFALNTAKAFISSGTYKNVLVIAADSNSKFVDWNDRASCILFGDGAGAAVLKESVDGIDDIIEIDIHSNGKDAASITLPLSGENCPMVAPCEKKPLKIYMAGREVYKFVVQTMPDSISSCLERAGLTPDDIDYLIPHQANYRIIEAMASRLNYGKEKIVTNLEKYGNTSAASIPIALAEGVETGHVKLPAKAILSGFGAGLTWGTAIVRLREGIV